MKSIVGFFTLLLLSTTSQASERLTIAGVDGEIRDNIELLLKNRFNDCISVDSKPDQVFQQRLQETIASATKPYGYYSPTLEFTALAAKDDCAAFQVSVKLNAPIQVKQLYIKLEGAGQQDEHFTDAIKGFQLKTGDRLEDKYYTRLKKRLESLAIEYGYLDYQFLKNEILISQKNKTAEIHLTFDTGKRYRLGKIEVEQKPKFLAQEFLEALIPLTGNDYFTNSELFTARQNLLETDYFETVTIHLQREKAVGDQVPVLVTVTPQDRIDYSVGVGFSTDTNARVRFEYNNRRMNETGYQFSSALNLSEVIKEISAGIKLPSSTAPTESWYNIDAGYKEERTDELKSNTAKLGASWTYAGAEHWKSVGFIDVVYDEFDTGTDEDTSLLVIPGVSWSYLKADDTILPNRGFKLQAELQGAHKGLLSDASFIQLSASYKGIFTLKPKHRLITRLSLGTTNTSDITDLPLDYRFFAGGDNSVRGFDYRAISPRNDDGDLVGGKHLTVASLEYDYRFKDSWALAFFTDAGSAFNDSPDFQYSAGLGLRWISPIGPIRFDVAVPIDNPENDFRIHISLGPDL